MANRWSPVSLKTHRTDRGLKVKRNDERVILAAIKSRGNDPLPGPLIGIRGSGPSEEIGQGLTLFRRMSP